MWKVCEGSNKFVLVACKFAGVGWGSMLGALLFSRKTISTLSASRDMGEPTFHGEKTVCYQLYIAANQIVCFSFSARNYSRKLHKKPFNLWHTQVIGIGWAPAVRLTIALTTLPPCPTTTGTVLTMTNFIVPIYTPTFQ